MLPVQTSEGQRIRTEVQAFIKRVADYQRSFHQRSFYKYATGAANAYPAIDQVSDMRTQTVLSATASRVQLQGAQHACCQFSAWPGASSDLTSASAQGVGKCL